MFKVVNSFDDLGLHTSIIDACRDIGYKNPLPIQMKCIPYLLDGHDVLGKAHTGSGKTAAFLLPLLHQIDIKCCVVQGLIIAPTRELAIQIKSVCSIFAKYIKEINIIAIYGGQNYTIQFNFLKKGTHIIIGTPGRLLDHLRRGTINLSNLKTLIIDEADEMLRMGFVSDVKNIIKYIPVKHQTALFSATLPKVIRQISYQLMNHPKEVYINSNTTVCSDIKQSYWLVSGISKHEALARFLEIEDFHAVIVFVRTKEATLKISKILENYGCNSVALNGDMHQTIRDQTLFRFRNGLSNILIATDIASRGLDVDRVSLVINYDMPVSSDDYIHRIGRTGRAGCIGKSLLFVERQQYRLFRSIVRNINTHISSIRCPTFQTVMNHRLIKFSKRIAYQLTDNDLDQYRSLLTKIKPSTDVTTESLAAVLLKMVQGNRPLILPADPNINNELFHVKGVNKNYRDHYQLYKKNKESNVCSKNNANQLKSKISNITLYRISVGKNDGIKVHHIIRILINDIHLHRRDIGNIQLFPSYTIIELTKVLSISRIKFRSFHLQTLKRSIDIKFLGNTSSQNFVKDYNKSPLAYTHI